MRLDATVRGSIEGATQTRTPPRGPAGRRMFAAAALLAALLGAPPLPAQLPGGGKPSGEGTSEGAGSILELQRGIRLLRAGLDEEARKHFAGMADRDPHGAMPRYYLALAYAGLGNGAGCLAALRAAAERGWDEPEALPEDPGLAELRAADETFRAGLDALAAAWRARAAEGTLPGDPVPAAEFTGPDGATHALRVEGKSTAVLFVDADDPQHLSAILALVARVAARDDLRGVVLARCPEKEETDRRARLARFRDELGIDLPVGLATDELERLAKPLRARPTLLVIDREGRARRIVEGFPPDLEERYARALKEEAEEKAEEPSGD